ncbi:hypothetical protein F2A37_24040 [Pseudomonas chlororaphis]|nr:hypothetical protein F2A37_24040 [Pseudomonas chlororaphis]POA70729.1 hypothetical protein C1888_14855 [Pseudomonas sp. GW531-T4]PWY51335.1 hypothetical protein DK261_04880 [Pseudomonas sp. RW409]QHC91558.1 hypothetical protein PchlR47_25735 [Pseudomonas chlororaphis]
MLAMVVNDDAVYPKHRGALGFIASKLAPTGGGECFQVDHKFFTIAHHRLSFRQVRSICVNGSVDYGCFATDRFE